MHSTSSSVFPFHVRKNYFLCTKRMSSLNDYLGSHQLKLNTYAITIVNFIYILKQANPAIFRQIWSHCKGSLILDTNYLLARYTKVSFTNEASILVSTSSKPQSKYKYIRTHIYLPTFSFKARYTSSIVLERCLLIDDCWDKSHLWIITIKVQLRHLTLQHQVSFIRTRQSQPIIRCLKIIFEVIRKYCKRFVELNPGVPLRTNKLAKNIATSRAWRRLKFKGTTNSAQTS